MSKTIHLWTINCNKKESCLVSYTDYTTMGDILDTGEAQCSTVSWSPIVPDSIQEILYRTVCKETKKKR